MPTVLAQADSTTPYPSGAIDPHPTLHGLTILEQQLFTTTPPNSAAGTGITNWATSWCDAMVQWNLGNKNPWYALWDTSSPTVSMHDWGESDDTYIGWEGADGVKLAADHILPPVTAASPAGIFYSPTDPYLAAVVMSFTLGNGATVQFMDYVTFSPGYLLRSLEVYLYFFNRPTAPLSIGTQGNAFASAYAASLSTYSTGDNADYTSLFHPSVTPTITPSATPLAGVVVDNTWKKKYKLAMQVQMSGFLWVDLNL